jgi:hypothetical protein
MFVHYVIAVSSSNSSTPTWSTAEQEGRRGPDCGTVQGAEQDARQQVVTAISTESRSRCGSAGMVRCDPCRDLLDATVQN